MIFIKIKPNENMDEISYMDYLADLLQEMQDAEEIEEYEVECDV